MKSSELRFEYNFLATKLNIDGLTEVYQLADNLLKAYQDIDELSDEVDLISLSNFVSKWVYLGIEVDELQKEVSAIEEKLKPLKNNLKSQKAALKTLEAGVPAKAKTAAKTIKENFTQFEKSLRNIVTKCEDKGVKSNLEDLPMLKKVIDKVTGT